MSNDDKDYGPSIVGAILGMCIGNYVRHEVTRDELLELVAEVYDGIIDAALKNPDGLQPGWVNDQINDEIDQIRRTIDKDDLPADRDEALQHLLKLFELKVTKIRNIL